MVSISCTLLYLHMINFRCSYMPVSFHRSYTILLNLSPFFGFCPSICLSACLSLSLPLLLFLLLYNSQSVFQSLLRGSYSVGRKKQTCSIKRHGSTQYSTYFVEEHASWIKEPDLLLCFGEFTNNIQEGSPPHTTGHVATPRFIDTSFVISEK